MCVSRYIVQRKQLCEKISWGNSSPSRQHTIYQCCNCILFVCDEMSLKNVTCLYGIQIWSCWSALFSRTQMTKLRHGPPKQTWTPPRPSPVLVWLEFINVHFLKAQYWLELVLRDTCMPYMFNAVSGGGFVLYHHHDPLFGCNDRGNHRPLYNGIRLYFSERIMP